MEHIKSKIMARLSQGILGGISGKIGNVVGSSWKGIAVVKSKPLSVANPRTSGQIAQRTKMTNTVDYAKSILAGVIKPLWDRFAQQQSGYNAWVSANIDLFTSVNPTPPESLQISTGQMVAVNPSSATCSDGERNVTVNWPTLLPDSLSLATDQVYIVVYNESQDKFGVSSSAAIRSAGTVVTVLQVDAEENDILRVYLAFRRADGTVVSNTGYISVVVSA